MSASGKFFRDFPLSFTLFFPTLFQTNSKAELMSDLDTLSRKLASIRAGGGDSSADVAALQAEVKSLKAGIDERDRTIEGLKDQMKYYVAFAENSITGRLDVDETIEEVVDGKEETSTEIQRLNKELSEAKVSQVANIELTFPYLFTSFYAL